MIADAIFGGFVSKAINDVTDISKEKIRNAVKNKNNKHQSLESQIYNIIVDVLNKITYNQYKKEQDKIYDAAESLLMGFKDSENDDTEIIRFSLSMLLLDKNEYDKFIPVLYHEISKEEYCELYKEILLLLITQKNRYTPVEIEKFNQKLDEIKEIIKDIKEEKNYLNINEQLKIKSKTQRYVDKWNENMFLNNFNDWDEKAGTNVKLKDVYLESHLPYFVFRNNDNISINIKKFLSEYINKKNKNKMLLILGQPGIGKSTLITWITTNFTSNIDNILVYQFASDLKDLTWENISNNTNISDKVLEVLGLAYDDLDGKTLILDGFDEINAGNRRLELLNQIFWEMIKDSPLTNFSLIITCRENYIQGLNMIKCDYITLQPWNEEQIKSFCAIYQKKINSNISDNTMRNILKNRDILGIPLILYMVLALNISIEGEGSIVDVYDQVFSLEGGIYDRCINDNNYENPHEIIKQIKNQIHQISREIAIWMFENNSNETYIPENEYTKICEKTQEGIEYDILIGSFFRLIKHCEGIETNQLYFVHRTIYEYFVAETIYTSIENAVKELSENSQEELAKNIAIYLKQGKITNTIGEYLRHKIIKLYNKLNNEKKERFYQWWEETIEKMMDIGMFYYTRENIQNYKNIIDKEISCFINLIKILRELMCTGRKRYIMESINREQLEQYIKHCSIKYRMFLDLTYIDLSMLNLKGINLAGVKLINVNLEGTNLLRANLNRADLRGAVLIKVDLSKANLSAADLRGANLSGTNLSETNLSETNLSRTNLREANLRGANLRRADLRELDLEGADLEKVNLEMTKWVGVNLSGTNLRGANLEKAILIKVDLRKTNLNKANLYRANLAKIPLIEANLSEVNLWKGNLRKADLRKANLYRANLNKANLYRADLSGAILTKVDLSGAVLIKSNLSKSNLYMADLSEAVLYKADLNKVDLNGADLTETIFDENQVEYLEDKYNLQGTKVYIEKTDEIITYEEYCNKRKIDIT